MKNQFHNATQNAAKQRAWIGLCSFDPRYSGAIPSASRAESSLVALRLALQGWAFRTHGLAATPAIYTQPATHDSIEQATRILFWREDTPRSRPVLRQVPADRDGALDADAFAAMIAQDRARGLAPLIAVGTFGNDKNGAVDPLRGMAEICRRNEIWFHVDAARHGRFLAHASVASKFRAGFAAADSVAAPGCFLTSYPSRLEKIWGRKPGPVAAFCRAAENYAEYLAKQAEKDLARPGTCRFAAKLGL